MITTIRDTFITPEVLAEMSRNQSYIVKFLLYKEIDKSFNQDNISINSLPHDVHDKIVEHYKRLLPSRYVLRDWVPKDKLDWFTLSGNSCAYEILMEYYEENRVCINNFSDNENPQIIEFIKKRIEYEKGLSKEEYKKIDIYDVLDWSYISANPNAIDILKDNVDKINWFELSSNTNPRAIELLREQIDKENKMPEDMLNNLFNY